MTGLDLFLFRKALLFMGVVKIEHLLFRDRGLCGKVFRCIRDIMQPDTLRYPKRFRVVGVKFADLLFGHCNRINQVCRGDFEEGQIHLFLFKTK